MFELNIFKTKKINAHCRSGVACCVLPRSTREFAAEVAELTGLQNIASWSIKAEKSVEAWCPEEDSNLHTLRHTDL
ncbi:MAG: hypothetical protein ACOH1I_03160, partial [Gallionellaceae bacterium]